jgi:hypothetical protein
LLKSSQKGPIRKNPRVRLAKNPRDKKRGEKKNKKKEQNKKQNRIFPPSVGRSARYIP